MTISADTNTPHHHPQDCIEEAVPGAFICPITLNLMQSPLMTKQGLNFERSAILSWLQTHETCPLTRQPLNFSDLVTNWTLFREIQKWKDQHGLVEGHEEADEYLNKAAIYCTSSLVPHPSLSMSEQDDTQQQQKIQQQLVPPVNPPLIPRSVRCRNPTETWLRPMQGIKSRNDIIRKTVMQRLKAVLQHRRARGQEQ